MMGSFEQDESPVSTGIVPNNGIHAFAYFVKISILYTFQNCRNFWKYPFRRRLSNDVQSARTKGKSHSKLSFRNVFQNFLVYL